MHFNLFNYNNMYNNLEKTFYNLKDDCVFNTDCLLTPNNHSFANYKRPDNKGNFYSQTVPNTVINKGCKKINCQCVSCYNSN